MASVCAGSDEHHTIRDCDERMWSNQTYIRLERACTVAMGGGEQETASRADGSSTQIARNTRKTPGWAKRKQTKGRQYNMRGLRDDKGSLSGKTELALGSICVIIDVFRKWGALPNGRTYGD